MLLTTRLVSFLLFFFFNDTATTEIYTLSLHDALPISGSGAVLAVPSGYQAHIHTFRRSEEHTSELQSPVHLVCRLLLEKKKIQHKPLVRELITIDDEFGTILCVVY